MNGHVRLRRELRGNVFNDFTRTTVRLRAHTLARVTARLEAHVRLEPIDDPTLPAFWTHERDVEEEVAP